jgi:hypothetical protein
MKKILIFAVCALGFAFAANAQTTTSAPAATKTEDQIAAEKSGIATTSTQHVEKKECAGASKSCSKASGKSCCKAKTGEASAAAAPAEKKSCCKDKAAGTASCKGHETSANGEKKSCAKPCCKKSEN